jgi:hypothetical protein
MMRAGKLQQVDHKIIAFPYGIYFLESPALNPWNSQYQLPSTSPEAAGSGSSKDR